MIFKFKFSTKINFLIKSCIFVLTYTYIMMKNVIKCCLVCSVLINNIFVYPCCEKKPPKPEDGQKYIEYVLGIKSSDIIFSFSFGVQLKNNGEPDDLEFFSPYKSEDELKTEYNKHFKKNDDLEGCRSYWLLQPIKVDKHLTFYCSVYFVQNGKGNVNLSQSLEKCSGDIVDFFADISFYKLIEFKYDELKGDGYSINNAVGSNTRQFCDFINMYNKAVNDPKFKESLGYAKAKDELENIKDSIYKCK